MLRRPNDKERAPEPFDARQRQAERERAEAERVAYELEYVPPVVRQFMATPPATPQTALEQYLDALVVGRPLRGPALPPADLVGKYDPELEQRIREADRASSDAVSAAMAWENEEPGHPGFAALLDSDDEVVLIEHLGFGRYRGWLAAWRAQQAARAAEAEVRNYAAAAAKLRTTVVEARDAIGDEIRVRLEKARDNKSRRDYDTALDLTHEWRMRNNFVGWLQHPAAAWRPPHGNAWPGEVSLLEWEADGAISGTPRPEVPGLEGPIVDGQMLTSTGEVVEPPRRRGLFGRG